MNTLGDEPDCFIIQRFSLGCALVPWWRGHLGRVAAHAGKMPAPPLGRTQLQTAISAPRVGQAFARAQALCEQVDNVPQRFRALFWLRRYHNHRGENREAASRAHELVQLAEQENDPALLTLAYLSIGCGTAPISSQPRSTWRKASLPMIPCSTMR